MSTKRRTLAQVRDSLYRAHDNHDECLYTVRQIEMELQKAKRKLAGAAGALTRLQNEERAILESETPA